MKNKKCLIFLLISSLFNFLELNFLFLSLILVAYWCRYLLYSSLQCIYFSVYSYNSIMMCNVPFFCCCFGQHGVNGTVNNTLHVLICVVYSINNK